MLNFTLFHWPALHDMHIRALCALPQSSADIHTLTLSLTTHLDECTLMTFIQRMTPRPAQLATNANLTHTKTPTLPFMCGSPSFCQVLQFKDKMLQMDIILALFFYTEKHISCCHLLAFICHSPALTYSIIKLKL